MDDEELAWIADQLHARSYKNVQLHPGGNVSFTVSGGRRIRVNRNWLERNLHPLTQPAQSAQNGAHTAQEIVKK